MGSIPVGATFYSESINRYQWIEYLGSAETKLLIWVRFPSGLLFILNQSIVING
jgi:hypothetical protein